MNVNRFCSDSGGVCALESASQGGVAVNSEMFKCWLNISLLIFSLHEGGSEARINFTLIFTVLLPLEVG